MISAVSSQPFVAELVNAPSGEVGTVGVRIMDGSVTVTPRVTTGITESPVGSGRYLASLVAPTLPLGETQHTYSVVWDDDPLGNITPLDSAVETLSVGLHATPLLGPCDAWCDPNDLPCSASAADLEVYAAAASQLLYTWSGRQFGGVCQRVVRPCGRQTCFDVASQRWQPFWAGQWWSRYADDAPLCGCQALSRVPLAGWPVSAIVDVTIDGASVDPVTYRLDDDRWLTRLDGWWPACQDLLAAPDMPGSFVVTYLAGQTPPAPGVLAAQELACFLADQSPPDGECRVPDAVTNITRQGITYQINPQLPRAKQLPLVSEFLAAYNPQGLQRRAAVFSPDVEAYARPQGT